MSVREILKLAHREYTGFRARSRATVVVIGVLFGLLLAILMVMQGLENVVLKYAGSASGGKIILASNYEDENLVLQRIERYGGKVVDGGDGAVVAEFDDLKNAYEYFDRVDAGELGYKASAYEIVEVGGNQVDVYGYFRTKERDFVRPVSIVLVAVAAFILAFTMAHLLTSNAKTFVLYRTVGASKGQILLIYFMYLLGLCARAAVFAVILALVLAGIMTGAGWNYLTDALADFYPTAPQIVPILIGVNWRCVEVILWMFATVPVAFLLCFDQFSDRKMVQRLKGD